jgi:hypothetical protein
LHNAPSSTSNPSSQKTPFQTTNHPKRKNLIYTLKQQQNHQLLLLHQIIIIIIIIMNSCCLLPSLSLSITDLSKSRSRSNQQRHQHHCIAASHPILPSPQARAAAAARTSSLLIWSSFANPNNSCQTFTTTNLYKLAASPKQATVLSTRHAQSLSLSLSLHRSLAFLARVRSDQNCTCLRFAIIFGGVRARVSGRKRRSLIWSQFWTGI